MIVIKKGAKNKTKGMGGFPELFLLFREYILSGS